MATAAQVRALNSLRLPPQRRATAETTAGVTATAATREAGTTTNPASQANRRTAVGTGRAIRSRATPTRTATAALARVLRRRTHHPPPPHRTQATLCRDRLRPRRLRAPGRPRPSLLRPAPLLRAARRPRPLPLPLPPRPAAPPTPVPRSRGVIASVEVARAHRRAPPAKPRVAGARRRQARSPARPPPPQVAPRQPTTRLPYAIRAPSEARRRLAIYRRWCGRSRRSSRSCRCLCGS